MNFETIRGLVADITKAVTHFEGSAGEILLTYGPGAGLRVELSVTDVKSFGHDEVRQRYNATTGKLYYEICGPRTFTLRVKCEAHPYAERSPIDVLEDIRMGLLLPEAHDLLAVDSFGYVGTLTPITDLGFFAVDERQISVAVMDLSFSGAESRIGAQAVGYISTAEVGGSLEPGPVVVDPEDMP